MVLEKLYVQYQPDTDTRTWLTDIQKDLFSRYGSGTLVPIEELHVTVLHFGHISETFKQLRLQQSKLTRTAYDEALAAFVQTLKPQLPERCELSVTGLALFGHNKNTLVMTLKEDLALIAAYEVSMRELRVFARELGIELIAEILPRPRALQIQPTLTPHLSLIKGVNVNMLTDYSTFIGRKLVCNLSPDI